MHAHVFSGDGGAGAAEVMAGGGAGLGQGGRARDIREWVRFSFFFLFQLKGTDFLPPLDNTEGFLLCMLRVLNMQPLPLSLYKEFLTHKRSHPGHPLWSRV